MPELPADLVFDGIFPLRVRKTSRLGGIGRGTQCVCPHMADGDVVAGCSGRASRGGRPHITSSHAADKAAPDLLRSVQLPAGERPGSGEESPGAIIPWGLGLEQG